MYTIIERTENPLQSSRLDKERRRLYIKYSRGDKGMSDLVAAIKESEAYECIIAAFASSRVPHAF